MTALLYYSYSRGLSENELFEIDKNLIAVYEKQPDGSNLFLTTTRVTQIAKIIGRARTTIYRILKEELNYIPYNRLVKQEETYESK